MLKAGKIIAFTTALTAIAACSSQKQLQDNRDNFIKKEFRKADNNPKDSFISQTELNTYMGNSKIKIANYSRSKKGLSIDEFAAIITGKNVPQPELKHPEYIEFKPAETMEDAVNFAQKQLGVTLKLGENLVMANFVNELLTNVNNKMKGKSVLPREVTFNKNIASGWQLAEASWNNNLKRLSLGTYFIISSKEAQSKGQSFLEWLKENENKGPFKTETVFRIIYHEIGHANHYQHSKNVYKMASLRELTKRKIEDKHITREFLKDVENNDIIKKFHRKYALTSPAEYVADTFAYKIMGKNIPEEVDKLYVKYEGMPVPE